MRKLILIVVAVFVAVSLNAQIGVKVGYGLSKLSVDNPDENTKMSKGLTIGAVYEKNLVGEIIGVRVEGLYTQKGYDYYNKTEILGAQNITDFSVSVDYIEIPVLAKVKVGPIYGVAGPYFGIAIKGEQLGTSESSFLGVTTVTDIQDDLFSSDNSLDPVLYKKTDFGIQAGLGYEFGLPFAKAFLEARAGIGMSDLNEIESESDDYSKNLAFNLSVGILLGR